MTKKFYSSRFFEGCVPSFCMVCPCRNLVIKYYLSTLYVQPALHVYNVHRLACRWAGLLGGTMYVQEENVAIYSELLPAC